MLDCCGVLSSEDPGPTQPGILLRFPNFIAHFVMRHQLYARQQAEHECNRLLLHRRGLPRTESMTLTRKDSALAVAEAFCHFYPGFPVASASSH